MEIQFIFSRNHFTSEALQFTQVKINICWDFHITFLTSCWKEAADHMRVKAIKHELQLFSYKYLDRGRKLQPILILKTLGIVMQEKRAPSNKEISYTYSAFWLQCSCKLKKKNYHCKGTCRYNIFLLPLFFFPFSVSSVQCITVKMGCC